MTSLQPFVKLPGEEGVETDKAEVQLPGPLHQRHTNNSLYTSFTYVPNAGDIVVGVITQKYAEAYKVDINGSREGHLSTVAFLNATRQYNPSLEIGSVVLCAVACSHPNYDIMLTCISTDDTKGWSTKETYLGELKEGHTFTVPVHYAEMLLGHNCALCDLIGEKVACEIVVGTNGRVHVNSASPALTVAIANVIEKAENVGNFQEMQTLVQQTFQSRLDAINIHSDDDD